MGLIPVLTKAVQEQQEQIDDKDQEINNLTNRLENLEKVIQQLLNEKENLICLFCMYILVK